MGWMGWGGARVDDLGCLDGWVEGSEMWCLKMLEETGEIERI